MSSPRHVFSDLSGTTLAAPIASGDLSCTVVALSSSGPPHYAFPDYASGTAFTATLKDAATGTIVEQVLVTEWNVETNTISAMSRGVNGTTAQSFATGDKFQLLVVAADFNNAAFVNQPNSFNQTQTMNGAPIDEAEGAIVPSSSTINLETATGNYIHVSGTTSITGVTLNQGASREVVFDGILTLTNGANLILPSGANITTAAGDTAEFRGEASGVVRCVNYLRASGLPIVGGSFLPLAGGTMTGPIDEAQGTSVASATTTNLETATGNYIHITGTVTITGITLSNGASREVVFDGSLILTNGASLILPTGANITTAAGDTAEFRGEASGVVRCVNYLRSNGQALANPGGGIGTGQTWTNPNAVPGSRVLGSTYTNLTSQPIQILISIDDSAGDGTLLINGAIVAHMGGDNNNTGTYSAIIPVGNTYSATGTVLHDWWELR